MHSLFEAQVAKTPDAVAVVSGDERLTYRMLDAQSNALARRLQLFGVGPDKLVGICMQRSPAMVVALWAILKVGGAYVPLDPSYPPERLAFMVRDAGLVLILGDANSGPVLPPEVPRWVLEGPLPEDSAPVRSQATPRSLAYIIYTSGWTGVLKGVAIEHRGVVNYVTWEPCGVYPATGGCRAPVHSSLSFDLTVTSLIVPLRSGVGACLGRRG